ncbi:3'-5' exonuclease [Actinosynnema sp. NPDC020468]|uniref:3'-5' exonuclease n=1 Tax=Actinosynnema sp. NPDC020468 TaxID=3154488 RepID=UPI0033D250CD
MTALDPALIGRPLAVVDIEGNGARTPEIVELAVLPVDTDAPTTADLRTWLVRPNTPVNPVARRVHGIGEDEIADAPRWTSVAAEVESLLAGRTLVAHGAHVDYAVLGRHLPEWTPPMVLDTLALSRRTWPDLPSHSLVALVAHLGITPKADGLTGQKPHRAGHDTWCAWKVLAAVLAERAWTWTELVDQGALKPFRANATPEGGLW